jgi:hypothetical protein
MTLFPSPTPTSTVTSIPAPRPSSAPSPSPTPSPAVIGNKKLLFEYKNGQICTYLADPALAASLMEQIETALKLTDRADAQECPNYRPDPQ